MGLDTDFDCWHGPYSAFHRWRKEIAASIGIDLDKMDGFAENGSAWNMADPICKLLHHSDCDGQIDAADCLPIAIRLIELYPTLSDSAKLRVSLFAHGLINAHLAGLPVEFH